MGSKQSTDQSENKEADQTTNYGLLNLSASHSFHWSHVLIAVMCAIAVLALGKHLFKMHKKRMQRRLSATQPSAPPTYASHGGTWPHAGVACREDLQHRSGREEEGVLPEGKQQPGNRASTSQWNLKRLGALKIGTRKNMKENTVCLEALMNLQMRAWLYLLLSVSELDNLIIIWYWIIVILFMKPSDDKYSSVLYYMSYTRYLHYLPQDKGLNLYPIQA